MNEWMTQAFIQSGVLVFFFVCVPLALRRSWARQFMNMAQKAVLDFFLSWELTLQIILLPSKTSLNALFWCFVHLNQFRLISPICVSNPFSVCLSRSTYYSPIRVIHSSLCLGQASTSFSDIPFGTQYSLFERMRLFPPSCRSLEDERYQNGWLWLLLANLLSYVNKDLYPEMGEEKENILP